MKINKLPAQSELCGLFRYDPETGQVFWLESLSPRIKVGDRAGSPYKGGYILVQINGVKYLLHRIIYKMKHGIDPHYIDHIDGNPSNNLIKNLRSVTHKENLKNKRLPKSNTSGTIGVSWAARYRKWCAQIQSNNQKIHLGYFVKKQDAIAARKKAEIDHGFHQNHGRIK